VSDGVPKREDDNQLTARREAQWKGPRRRTWGYHRETRFCWTV